MTFYLSITFLAALFLLPSASARLFTVVNACPFTVWPAIYTDLKAGQSVPPFPTGWESPSLTSAQFAVPDNWKAGRIWGRRACDFTSNSGPTACLDGGCEGGLQCDPNTGTGAPPVTVAEWTFQGEGDRDFYNVSLVDGFNLPMEIIPSVQNCTVASCPVDLNPACPQPLIGPRDPSGLIVGCNSACVAKLDNNTADSANCCTGSHNTAATCPSSGVQYYSYFKSNCTNSYAYAFDEGSGTALWTCPSTLNSDYRLTFCPPPPGDQVPGPISAVPASFIPSTTPITSPTSQSRSGSSSSATSTNASGNSNSASPSGGLALLRAMATWALSVPCAVLLIY